MSANGTADAEAAGLRYSSDEEPGDLAPQGRPRIQLSHGARRRGLERAPTRTHPGARHPPGLDAGLDLRRRRGHLQATGRDVRGRKQYLYHADWRALRDSFKFDRMHDFGSRLPRVRDHIEGDLVLPGLQRERVLAAVVRLVDETLIRVGNEEYRRANGSFGATTMRSQHARVVGHHITVEFKGKSGKLQHSEVYDRRLARTLQKLEDLPGRELFEYVDDEGDRRAVRSDDVNG